MRLQRGVLDGGSAGAVWLCVLGEDSCEGCAVVVEEDEPEDRDYYPWGQAAGLHKSAEDQDVDDDRTDESEGQRDVAVE